MKILLRLQDLKIQSRSVVPHGLSNVYMGWAELTSVKIWGSHSPRTPVLRNAEEIAQNWVESQALCLSRRQAQTCKLGW